MDFGNLPRQSLHLDWDFLATQPWSWKDAYYIWQLRYLDSSTDEENERNTQERIWSTEILRICCQQHMLVDIGYINGWGKQKYTWTTNHLEWYLEYFVEDVWSPVRQIKAEEDNSSSSCGNVGPGRWNSYILQHVRILNLESNCLFL